jgi:hypothetical protein
MQKCQHAGSNQEAATQSFQLPWCLQLLLSIPVLPLLLPSLPHPLKPTCSGIAAAAASECSAIALYLPLLLPSLLLLLPHLLIKGAVRPPNERPADLTAHVRAHTKRHGLRRCSTSIRQSWLACVAAAYVTLASECIHLVCMHLAGCLKQPPACEACASAIPVSFV